MPDKEKETFLRDKVVLVAGATGGVGSIISSRFLTAQCRVFGASRNVPKEMKKSQGAASLVYLAADFTLEADVTRVFDHIIHTASRIDIVVNAVGGYLPVKPLSEVSLEEWNNILDINLKSSFLVTREAIRRMERNAYGCIINIAAMAGLQPSAGRIPYSIAKQAIVTLTELAGRELAGSAVTVNAIAPGTIGTPANLASATSEEARSWASPSQVADVIVSLCLPTSNVTRGTTVRL